MTEQQEILIELLDQGATRQEIADKLGVSIRRVYQLIGSNKDAILERQRDKLATASIKAVDTVIASMSADANTEKGELRLKAAESVLNRTGLTSHTSVEVQIESENGLFILPGKQEVSTEGS